MHKKYVDLLMLFTTLYIQRQQQNEIINGTPQYIVLIILINDIEYCTITFCFSNFTWNNEFSRCANIFL